jgi:hypothetical protein
VRFEPHCQIYIIAGAPGRELGDIAIVLRDDAAPTTSRGVASQTRMPEETRLICGGFYHRKAVQYFRRKE